MRALIAAATVVALGGGCRPDIGFGTYSCGPNADCPGGQVCDESTDVCRDPPNALPFECTGSATPGSTLATATQVTETQCAAGPQDFDACLGSGDALGLFAFTTPSGCSDLQLEAVMTYAIAYETLELTLTGSDGTTVVATDTDCADSTRATQLTTCVSAPLDPSTSYVLRVEPVGNDDSNCGGACAFNRYDLSIQLTTR